MADELDSQVQGSIATELKRARFAVAMAFVALGAVLGVWATSIPLVKEKTGLTDGELGFALLGLPLGTLIALKFVGRCVTIYGSRPVVRLSLLALCVLMIPASFAWNLWSLVVVLIVAGVCAGFVDTSMNAHAVVVEKLYRRSIMSSFHAFFSVGGLCGSAMGVSASLLGVGIVTRFAVACLFITVVAMWSTRLLLPAKADAHESTGTDEVPHAKWSKPLVMLGLIVFAGFCVEGAAADWSAVYLNDHLHASTAVSAIAFGAYSAAMTISRFLGDRVIDRFNAVRILQCSGGIAATGLVVGLLTNEPWLNIASWALVGVGLAASAPIAFTAAGTLKGVPHGDGIAKVAGLGYLGVLLGPAIIGGAASQVGLRVALTIPLALCVGLALSAGAGLRAHADFNAKH